MSDRASSGIARRGLCLVLAAPSGAGKGVIGRALLATESGLGFSISVTTRRPRPGERNGVDYHFVDEADFTTLAEEGELLEWARVFGHGYGTPRRLVEAALAAGQDVLFDIDWQGHQQLRAALPDDVVSIFLLTPSLAELDGRLRGRGTDDADEIARRMTAARDEIAHWAEFDHVVLNRALDDAIADVRSILRAARLRTGRQTGLARFVAGLAGGN